MSEDSEPEWSACVSSLRRDEVPAASANAQLLEGARDRWEGQVVARRSMHDLFFTVPGKSYPFPTSVRVHWDDGVFEFQLRSHQSRLLVTADRCTDSNSRAVLDSFLMQLVESE